MFTQYKGRKPVNRQVKHTMLHDIGILGYSLANKSPLKELERIVHSPSESSEVISHQTTGDSAAQQTSLTDILATVASLSRSLTKLEDEVASIKEKHKDNIPGLHDDVSTSWPSWLI